MRDAALAIAPLNLIGSELPRGYSTSTEGAKGWGRSTIIKACIDVQMIVFTLGVISCDGHVETRWLRSKNCDGGEQKTTAYIPEDTFSADTAVYGKTWPTKSNFFCSVERRPIVSRRMGSHR